MTTPLFGNGLAPGFSGLPLADATNRSGLSASLATQARFASADVVHFAGEKSGKLEGDTESNGTDKKADADDLDDLEKPLSMRQRFVHGTRTFFKRLLNGKEMLRDTLIITAIGVAFAPFSMGLSLAGIPIFVITVLPIAAGIRAGINAFAAGKQDTKADYIIFRELLRRNRDGRKDLETDVNEKGKLEVAKALENDDDGKSDKNNKKTDKK